MPFTRTRISTFTIRLGLACLLLTGTALAGVLAEDTTNHGGSPDCTTSLTNADQVYTMGVSLSAGQGFVARYTLNLGTFATTPALPTVADAGAADIGDRSGGGGLSQVEYDVFPVTIDFVADITTLTLPAPEVLFPAGSGAGTTMTITIDLRDELGDPIDTDGVNTVDLAVLTNGCAPPPPIADHFLSYQIKHKAEVFLADQFIQGFFRIGEPERLLNPADKDGGGIFDPDTHLVSYKVKGPEFDKVENVLVVNQFGDFVVDVKKPDRLLVPASKSQDGPFSPPPPDNSTHDVDHFLCYQIDDDDDDDNLGILISVVDQFNQPKLFDVKKPRRFCNPVDKNGEGIKNPQTHLMCFSVRRASGEPKHERIDGIFVNDQFGPGRVRTKKERELCVPSTITLP